MSPFFCLCDILRRRKTILSALSTCHTFDLYLFHLVQPVDKIRIAVVHIRRKESVKEAVIERHFGFFLGGHVFQNGAVFFHLAVADDHAEPRMDLVSIFHLRFQSPSDNIALCDQRSAANALDQAPREGVC